MKKLPLLITIGLVLLLGGGYFAYDHYFQESDIRPWDIVPEGTVLVYESSDCHACVEQVENSSIWKALHQVAFYSRNSDSLKIVFDFLSKPPSGSLVSMHVTKKDDFDFVFYEPLLTVDEKQFLTNAISLWRKNKRMKFSEREFNAVKIQEMSYANQVFSWAFLDNVWVGSFTPFLIEDVVRTYESESRSSFRKEIAEVYQLPRIKKDAGNLYVHLKNFSEWLSVFKPNQIPTSINQFGKSSLLDIKSDANNFVLNGFSLDSLIGDQSILSIFNDQDPTPFELKKFISNRSVLACLYGISEGESLGKRLQSFSAAKHPAWKDTLQQLTTSFAIDFDALYKSLGEEVGVCMVESRGQHASKIGMIQVKDSKLWLKALYKISEKLSVDTVFIDKFSDYEIRELPLYRFPEKIFWPLITGFDHSYYTHLGNTIFFGEDLEELKKYLDDIDHEDTWGKSVNQNHFLESTLLEANVSVYINTPRVWNILSNSLHPKWKKFIQENQALTRSLGMGAIQFSHLNESFYTNVSWSYGSPSIVESTSAQTEQLSVNFEKPILTRPFIVKNHIDKSDEVLVQDSSFNLYLLSSKGKVIWKLGLSSPIKGTVDQIDYFNNGKLQYVFATSGMLHVIDRLGNYVNPYPIRLNSRDNEYLSVVDYDHSKKYRFLVADQSGKLWMYDKEGKSLEGWKPKSIVGSMFTPPQHHRIRGKDYILSIARDGIVNLMNRKGEIIKNFPMDLEAKPFGNYFLETGSTTSTTYFIVVSRDGFRIKFNLEGKIQSRETLIKTSLDARFGLIAESKNKNYLIARQEPKQLILMDDTGKEIIRNDFVGVNPIDIQYFDFGAGRVFITLTDTMQDLTYIYDEQGSLLTTPPVESYFVTIRPAVREQIKIFSAFQKSLTIQPL